MKRIKDNRGMTIMEVIVTIMVLAISLTIITSGIFAANNLMSEGRKVQRSLDYQDSVLHGEEIDSVVINEAKEKLSFRITDTTYNFSGKTKSTSEPTSKDVNLQAFYLEDTNDYGVEWQMFKNMQGMPDLHRSWTIAEKDEILIELKKLGASSTNFYYMNNDLFIYYIYHYIYNENLPKLDSKYLPEMYAGAETFYLHPFLAKPLETSENIIIYATTTSSHGVGNWQSFMIFDYGDGTDPSKATGWYYHTKQNYNGTQLLLSNISVNTLVDEEKGPYKSWNEFREKVLLKEADGWKHVSH